MRIAIVNDMGIAVEVLKKVITSAGYEIAWIARNGERAIEKCCADVPDIVLMDLNMPVMDGAEATRRIMKKCPCSILVVTASIENNASKVFEAMGAGALDVVATPELGTDGALKGDSNLISKISVLSKLQNNGKHSHIDPKPRLRSRARPPLLAIGSSTGGPSALATLLGDLPEDFPAAIAIVQHVDGQFSENLAQWLDSQTEIKVSLARNGEMLQAGQAVIAPGDTNMLMRPGGTVQITPNSDGNLYVPSVDLFYDSLCCAGFPANSAAVLLTGMGADGAKGLLELKNSGWLTIAQDEKSSVVWGMPGAAVKLNAAREICSINDMARILTRHFNKRFQEKVT
ncbi:chemotaxis response regulator protein-glutamate methylesterase [Maridesulfovibrio hydrothermalis]|uniref:Protein-glutamate methylesterase/protein-glutamine glutaminase n=1 Tax=Maridesulfovibrio hydrothermalis AM13 = DSM 14728 TaxID=1121451 RepID=L0R8P7_9BACT|nr:chemotaxis response regulator protein-glutamate methylesterase [Maridesulfovibrio hydrothermalis]CCO23134.1 Chemotaxis response regulator protein-glutamate methylesterase [Maridesulfovibrio hydrothermalis AM13 = DSM 14728]